MITSTIIKSPALNAPSSHGTPVGGRGASLVTDTIHERTPAAQTLPDEPA